MNAREAGLKQADAAVLAEISARTGQRIESGRHCPNRGRVRDWRTSADPLIEVWESELEPMLLIQGGESFIALSEGLQNALLRAAVPPRKAERLIR